MWGSVQLLLSQQCGWSCTSCALYSEMFASLVGQNFHPELWIVLLCVNITVEM